MKPTAAQLKVIDETEGFDVDIPQELEDLVDGKVQTVEWEDDPNVDDIYEEDDGADAWEEWDDIDVEDLYDLVEAKAGGNDTPIVREDWELLAKQEAKLRKLGKSLEISAGGP